MHKYKRAARRQAWYSQDKESTNYNPFAKRVTRLNSQFIIEPHLERAVSLDQAPQERPYDSDDFLPPTNHPDVQPAYVPNVSSIIAQASIAGQIRSSWQRLDWHS